MPDHTEPEFAEDLHEPVAERAEPPVVEEPPAWRRELSERIRSFRQRRARLRNEPVEEESLELEFEASEASAPAERGVEDILEFPKTAPALEFPPTPPALEFPQTPPTVDAEITPSAGLDEEAQLSEIDTLEKGDEGVEVLDPALARADEFPAKPESPTGNRLEIVVGPSVVDASAVASRLELIDTLPVAPLGPRFLAGLADGLVLLFGAGVFAFIFWRAGGHLTPVPLNLAVVGLIAAIFVWAYFGLFTALAYSTPGLIWMRIEVRNMEGWPPTLGESLLRAFGYLVSISALMIGFLWALLDSESLTWHDWISGTFLTSMRQDDRGESVRLQL